MDEFAFIWIKYTQDLIHSRSHSRKSYLTCYPKEIIVTPNQLTTSHKQFLRFTWTFRLTRFLYTTFDISLLRRI